jgi:hypothetical protein
MVIVVVVVVVVAVAVCAMLIRELTRARASAREAKGQVEGARAEATRATGDLDAAKGELAEAKTEAQAAREEADRAKADAQTQRVQAAGARAEAEAARVKMAELTRLAETGAGADEGASPGAFEAGSFGAGSFGSGGVAAGPAASVAGAGAGPSTVTRPGAEGAIGSGASGAESLVSRQGGPPASMLGALWSLARIRQEWLSRQVAGMTLEDAPEEGTWAQVTLEEVLDEEVSRIREDTGTPGALRTSLHDEPPAGEALLLLAGVQALLEALTRHCQAYDLYVHHWEQRLTAIVVCEGFDGPDRVATDTEAVLSAIAPAGGELALDRDQQGRLRARLSLPFRQPAEI